MPIDLHRPSFNGRDPEHPPRLTYRGKPVGVENQGPGRCRVQRFQIYLSRAFAVLRFNQPLHRAIEHIGDGVVLAAGNISSQFHVEHIRVDVLAGAGIERGAFGETGLRYRFAHGFQHGMGKERLKLAGYAAQAILGGCQRLFPMASQTLDIGIGQSRPRRFEGHVRHYNITSSDLSAPACLRAWKIAMISRGVAPIRFKALVMSPRCTAPLICVTRAGSVFTFTRDC